MGMKISEWLLKTNVMDVMDKVSAAYNKVNQVTAKATEAWDKLNSGGRRTITTIGELKSKVEQLKLDRKAAVTTDEIRRLNTEILVTEKELNRLKNLPPKSFLDQIKLGTGLFGQMAAAVGIAFSLSAVQSFGNEVITTTGKYERFAAVLTNAQGKGQAFQSLQMLSDFASNTPYQVDELTDSYVKLVNRGLAPSQEALGDYGDLAASTGKSFLQFTEAVLDATTGEFERLKEFGIKASKEGDKATLSFKGLTQTVANTPAAINEALRAFGNMSGVAGAMDAISKTVEGKLSNLADKFDMFKLAIGMVFRDGLVSITDFLGGALDKLMGLADWMYQNRAAIGLFFKGLAVGAAIMGALAIQAWLVNLAIAPWIIVLIAVGAALLAAYQKIGWVRGGIDALIEIVSLSIEQWVLYWRIVYNVWEGIFKMFKGDFSFSGLEKALDDQVKLWSEAGGRVGKAFNDGVNSAIEDNSQKQTSLWDKLSMNVPGGSDPNSFLAGQTGADAAGSSTLSQSVTNITNQDQGQKSYVINIGSVVGIANYTDNSGKGRRAAERSGESVLESLTRTLNGANLAVQ